MAGHIIAKFLKQQGCNVTTAARTTADHLLDIENPVLLNALFEGSHYDYVINCTGILVKNSEANLDQAILVNSWFPHYLENKFKNQHTKLIHLSTDCVFNGATGYYIETDQHTETNVYGRTKSLGEVHNDKDITFRMSIIGPEIKQYGTGLFHWIYNNPEISVTGWENSLWNGITTLELAKCIFQYIENPKVAGVYHLVNNNNYINKYQLLEKINKIFDLNKIVIKTSNNKPVNKILVDTRNSIEFNIPNYDTQLLELKKFISY